MPMAQAKVKTKRVQTVSFNIQQTVPFLYRQIITEVEAKIKITTKMVVHTVYSNFHQSRAHSNCYATNIQRRKCCRKSL